MESLIKICDCLNCQIGGIVGLSEEKNEMMDVFNEYTRVKDYAIIQFI